MKDYMDLRVEVHKYAKRIYEKGWVSGSSGNISVRVIDEQDRYVITPTTVPYEIMEPEQIVVINGEGDLVLDMDYGPSVETPMHLAIYKARPDVNAIIHTHSIYSSVLSVLRKPIPPIIEELVPYVGGEILVAQYASAGSEELAKNALEALGERSAILLANHGNLCCAKNLLKAFNLCALVERSARIYLEALKSGERIHLLPEDVVSVEKEIYELAKEM